MYQPYFLKELFGLSPFSSNSTAKGNGSGKACDPFQNRLFVAFHQA